AAAPTTMAEPRTLVAMLLAQGERFGERPFLSIAGGRWSHADTARVAARSAAALCGAGIGRGDRVAVMSGNRAETLEVVLGCGWIGAVAVPINTASMGPQIGHVLADSGAELLVVEAAFVDRLALAGAGRLRTIWVVGADADADAEGDGNDDNENEKDDSGKINNGKLDVEPDVVTASAADLVRHAAASAPSSPYPRLASSVSPADVRASDALAILYTSGTTGPAKGVVCPHSQFFAWGGNSAR